jgi:hypothetical protein
MVGMTASIGGNIGRRRPEGSCTSLSRRHDLLILCARIGFNP